MTQDDFDKLVDDATHAVGETIPTHILDNLSNNAWRSFLYRINDALTQILSDLI